MAGTHDPNNTLFTSDISSPGYIQSVASSKRKTKENLRTDELIPENVLENSAGIQVLLEAYYTYMNLDEFIYQEYEEYQDVILDGKAVFRVNDPLNQNDHFFTDDDGANTTLTVTDSDGNVTTLDISSFGVNITNGNNLPGSLANSTSAIGKTFNISGLTSYNTQIAKIRTPVKYWAGPGSSYSLNTIEEAMDIDYTSDLYLELIQKEIAAVIPRNLQTPNKKNLYKKIVEYYKVRGSSDSIEIFFRLLFDDEVEVEYPWNETLIPSSGNWEVNPNLPKGGIYLDNKGFLSDNIKIQDSLKYQKFSYLIRTGQSLSAWKDVFARLVHPAGFKFFAEILLQLFATRDELGDDTKEERELFYIGGPKHGLPTGEKFVGYGRTNRITLSSMPDLQPGVIGIEDIPLLVEAFVASFLPSTEIEIHKSARLSLTVESTSSDANYGSITGVEIVEPGFGYATAPTVVINGVALSGQTISQATITTTIDSNGKVVGTTIVNAGDNYSSAFANVAANPNISKIASIAVLADTSKEYSVPPGIIFGEPTSKDGDGVLLSTNVTATGKYVLEPTPVQKIEITHIGSAYTAVPDVVFSQPETHFTAQPFFTEDFENASVSTANYNSWRKVVVNDHTVSIDSTEADTGSKSLKIQTSTLDTDASGSIGGAVRRLKLDAPEFVSRLPGNRIKVKVRAKKASSNGASFFEMAYSTSQHGNSNWQRKTLTTDWADYEFEYTISASTPTNEDYVGFQGDGNDGIVYIDNVSITVKWDYPRALAEIEDGSVTSIKLLYKGSGYTDVPSVTLPGNATAKAFLVPSPIASAIITNAGFGYINEPEIYLSSQAKNEDRAKSTPVKKQIEFNHTNVDPVFTKINNPVQSSPSVRGRTLYAAPGGSEETLRLGVLTSGQNWTISQSTPATDKTMGGYSVTSVASGYRTRVENNYFNQKKKFLDGTMIYDFNETFQTIGDIELQSTSTNDINKYNVSSFIHKN